MTEIFYQTDSLLFGLGNQEEINSLLSFDPYYDAYEYEF